MGPTHDEGGATLSLPLCAGAEVAAMIDVMVKAAKKNLWPQDFSNRGKMGVPV
jgi:hypothetical protein